MRDAIDELVARSKDAPELRAFYAAHRAHPEVLDFLVREIQLRIDHGFEAFSYRSLWEYARWQLVLERGPETFLLNDHDVPMYSRAIAILHPTFNGRAKLRKSVADEIFGLRFEPLTGDRPEKYARRLEWDDGTPLEVGWRPTWPHAPNRALATKRHIHAHPAARRGPRLFEAARLVLAERDNLANSAPRGTLHRLETLASALRQIEGRL